MSFFNDLKEICGPGIIKDGAAQGKYVMSIEKIMTTNTVTVELDDTLVTVKEIFDNLKFHHLLVVESGKLIGVVSDRDLLKAISPNIGTMAATYRDDATLNKKVYQVMTRKPITLGPHDPIGDAVDLFITQGISCIPIVDREFRPVGILTWRDILKAIVRK
jgi:acetoin utilization protein AcuB